MKNINRFFKKYFISLFKRRKDKLFYFFNNFKYFFIFLFLIFCFVKYRTFYKSKYNRDNILISFKKAEYLGNAVSINTNSFLTNYSILKNACINNNGEVRFFLLSNNKKFEVYLSKFDEYNNLAILNSYNEESDIFAIFDDEITNKDKYIYLSKTDNSFDYKYYKYSVRNNDKYINYIKTKDYIRDYSGEIAINNKFEFVGIVNYERFGFLNKSVYLTDIGVIKQFLKDNNIIFVTNYADIDLRKYNNYIGNINYKLVCVNDILKRSPTTLKIYR